MDAIELRGPCGQGIRLGGVKHVAHGQRDGIQIILNAQKLQGIFAITVDHVALEAAQSRKLHGDVRRVSQHGGQRNDQAEKQAGGRGALGGELLHGLHRERIPQARMRGRNKATSTIIAAQPQRGTSKPTRKLLACCEINPTSQGIVAPPTAAIENITPPSRRARSPYHLESQEKKMGKTPARQKPASTTARITCERVVASNNDVVPTAEIIKPVISSKLSFTLVRINAEIPRPDNSPAQKNMGMTAEAFPVPTRWACSAAHQEIAFSVPMYK